MPAELAGVAGSAAADTVLLFSPKQSLLHDTVLYPLGISATRITNSQYFGVLPWRSVMR
jgi:hypothetical protein